VRILIPVGGAGAQKSFVTKFLESLGSQIRNKEVQIILNAGDHKHMKESFLASIKKMGFKKDEFEIISSMEGVNAFADRLRSGSEPGKAITLFAFDDYFPAVAATDVLCRVTDVLACKPSELAFYPVPCVPINYKRSPCCDWPRSCMRRCNPKPQTLCCDWPRSCMRHCLPMPILPCISHLSESLHKLLDNEISACGIQHSAFGFSVLNLECDDRKLLLRPGH
jgi:hypothetical protein